jgi:hypothetical protein
MTAIAEIIEVVMWLLLAAYVTVKMWRHCRKRN